MPIHSHVSSILRTFQKNIQLTIVHYIFTDLNIVIIVLAMVGKFCIAVTFCTIYLFSAEVFPTVIRSIGISSCSFWARIGGIIAPYIGSLVRNVYDSPIHQ